MTEFLREFIQGIIIESDGITKEIQKAQDLALFVDPARHDTTFVLYDPKYYASRMKEEVEYARNHYNSIRFKEDLKSFKNYYSFSNVQKIFLEPNGIYGFLQVNEGRTIGMRNSCNMANEVRAVAAREGYGTLIYIIAMAHEAPIMANRQDVSDNSREIWSYFDQQKGEIDSNKFKDERSLHKKTKEDCEIYGDTSLDKSYALKKEFDLDELKRKHGLFLKQMKIYLKSNDVDFVKVRVQEYITSAGWAFYESTVGTNY